MTADQYGPHTAAVEAFLALLRGITSAEWEQVNAESCSDRAAVDVAWDAARGGGLVDAWWDVRDALWDALWDAAWFAVGHALWDAVWAAAREATRALVVRDLITDEQYATLVAPFAGIDRFAAVLTHPGKDTP